MVMMGEISFRVALAILLGLLVAMRGYFVWKVRRAGGRLAPDREAVQREGGKGVLVLRTMLFFMLIAILGMYLLGMAWIGFFAFPLPAWIRWIGFGFGLVTVTFWAWTQVVLDTQWSAQLQLQPGHRLITTGPYAHLRHPLYTGLIGWTVALILLTANWIFVALCILSVAGLVWRIPREERMMIKAFGDEYRAYMRRTGRYLPKCRR
jgi:protein-S-isoprenylcysteine O-methyltransferase Ste14